MLEAIIIIQQQAMGLTNNAQSLYAHYTQQVMARE